MNMCDITATLENEKEWRLKELHLCKAIPYMYTNMIFYSKRPAFYRMCVPLIYSHWEGFVISSFREVVSYINSINLSYTDANIDIIILANKSRFGYLQGNNIYEQQRKFTKEVLENCSTCITIDPSSISSHSNLNYKQLRNIFRGFGMNLDKNTILGENKNKIEKLVKFRNIIAHGENSVVVNEADITDFLTSVTRLMDEIMLVIINYLGDCGYLNLH